MSSYAPEYVRHLLKEYGALVAAADTTVPGLRYLVELADLHLAFAQLPEEYTEVLFWHGLVGLPQEQVADVLQKSQQWVSKRYSLALEELTWIINGGD